LPLSEAAGLITGTTPFTQAAAVGPPRVSPAPGPAPVDLGAIAGMQQADALARFQGAQQRQASALNVPVTLGAAYLGRG